MNMVSPSTRQLNCSPTTNGAIKELNTMVKHEVLDKRMTLPYSIAPAKKSVIYQLLLTSICNLTDEEEEKSKELVWLAVKI